MGLYDRYILPHCVHIACGLGDVRRQRKKVVPQATGRVLEVGMGSGFNLEFYDPSKVEMVFGLEPSEGMRKKAAANVAKSDLELRWLSEGAEAISLEDNSVDTVVLTYTLCTIPDWQSSLHEMRRVLKPGGQLLFTEHGAAPDAKLLRRQNMLNPMWKKVAGGCNIQRAIPDLISSCGFEIVELEASYLDGPKLIGFNYMGRATGGL